MKFPERILTVCCLLARTAAVAVERAHVQFLDSGKVLPAGLPFSEAVRVGDVVYLSGQVGNAPGTLKLVPGGIREESRQAMENIRATLETQGLAMSDLVKCTVMLADIGEWSTFNDVYKTYFVNHIRRAVRSVRTVSRSVRESRSSASRPRATDGPRIELLLFAAFRLAASGNPPFSPRPRPTASAARNAGCSRA